MPIETSISELYAQRKDQEKRVHAVLMESISTVDQDFLDYFSGVYRRRAEWACKFDLENAARNNLPSIMACNECRTWRQMLCRDLQPNDELIANKAKESWELNKQTFVARLGRKILSALCGHAEFTIEISLTRPAGSGLPEGITIVKTPRGHFRLITRHRCNISKNGNPFHQYPTYVKDVFLEGSQINRNLNIDELSALFQMMNEKAVLKAIDQIEAQEKMTDAFDFSIHNVKALAALHTALCNYHKRMERYKKLPGRLAGQHPDTEIKRWCKRLNLPVDTFTAADVLTMLANCLTPLAKKVVRRIGAEMQEKVHNSMSGPVTSLEWLPPTSRSWEGYAEWMTLKASTDLYYCERVKMTLQELIKEIN